MLTDIQAKAAKPREKDYKLSDGGGLFLWVRKNGTRSWCVAYRYGGKQKRLTIGTYPKISITAARAARAGAKELLSQGIDPGVHKHVAAAPAATFKDVAEEVLKKMESEDAAPRTLSKTRWLLEFAYPVIGARPIVEIKPFEVLSALRLVEARGLHESAVRLRSVVGRVFRYAVATGRAERDVSADLREALITPQVTHHAAILDPKQIGSLMRAIRGYKGAGSASFALRLLPYVFVRSSELRGARKAEFDIQRNLWRIPAERMKMKRDHIVPLSRQAVVIVKGVLEARFPGELLFPSIKTPERPISENTVNSALRRLGYETDEMTGHGFRRMASTILNENGFESDWIERQLAHVPGDKVRAAYNAAEWLEPRTTMMQWWADWLDRQAWDDDDLIG